MSGNQDFVIENGVLKKYNGLGGAVVIPKGVTKIGDDAFLGCTNLTQITIPDSVTEIGEFAFQDCTGLTDVTLPNEIQVLNHTFEGCTGLKHI